MRILVVGSDGMLGHVVVIYLKSLGYDVMTTSRSDKSDFKLDVSVNLNDINIIVDDIKPDVVINCVGMLNKAAEDNKALAVLVNSYLPHYLDEVCAANNIKFIHVSTDCVFDGKKGEYDETSFKDAVTFYGQSKALGEIDNTQNLTLRTSIVGPDTSDKGIGLFQWFMNQSGETNGFDKAIWTGVTTIELAKCIDKAIKNNLTGLQHVVNNQKIDKYSLINLFKTSFKKDIKINRKSDYVSDKSLVRTSGFDFKIPRYAQMVDEMAEWVKTNKDIYPKSQWVQS